MKKSEKDIFLKEHQELIPGRGVYDKRNDLNDKTGKEWRFATKSVIPYDFEETVFSNILINYPHILPTELAKNLVETFTKGDAVLLDPFAGLGSFLIAASLARTSNKAGATEIGRRARGIGQSVEMREIYLNLCKEKPEIGKQDYFLGTVEEFAQKNPSLEFDLIISEIPITKIQGTEDLAIEHFRTNGEVFDFKAWNKTLTSKLQTIWPFLRKTRYIVLIVPLDWFWHGIGKSQQNYYDLAYEVIKAAETSGAVFKSEISWFNELNSAKFSVELKKKILVFRKEDV
ncbi:MAG: hypothetical protein ACFFD4_04160 [Candidatus Odinarchaeota archaeon]